MLSAFTAFPVLGVDPDPLLMPALGAGPNLAPVFQLEGVGGGHGSVVFNAKIQVRLIVVVARLGVLHV